MRLGFAQPHSLDGNDWLTFLSLEGEPERRHCVCLLPTGGRFCISSLYYLRCFKVIFLFLPQKMPSAQGNLGKG